MDPIAPRRVEQAWLQMPRPTGAPMGDTPMNRVETRDGTHLFVKVWGQGRPVVLIHGWPLSSDSWDPIANRLADAGFRRFPMTGAALVAPTSLRAAIITTPSPTIWPM
jgi:hypothetical protein